jgi:hypothetical protein
MSSSYQLNARNESSSTEWLAFTIYRDISGVLGVACPNPKVIRERAARHSPVIGYRM